MFEVGALFGHWVVTWKLGDLWLLLEWVLLGGWVLLVLVLRWWTGKVPLHLLLLLLPLLFL